LVMLARFDHLLHNYLQSPQIVGPLGTGLAPIGVSYAIYTLTSVRNVHRLELC
jgi:hypothetical protein